MFVSHCLAQPSKNQISTYGLRVMQIQPSNSSIGISRAASQPSGTSRRTPWGSMLQASAVRIMSNGISRRIEKTAGKLFSVNGASQSPARNPRMTVGRASMISMEGLTMARSLGLMK